MSKPYRKFAIALVITAVVASCVTLYILYTRANDLGRQIEDSRRKIDALLESEKIIEETERLNNKLRGLNEKTGKTTDDYKEIYETVRKLIDVLIKSDQLSDREIQSMSLLQIYKGERSRCRERQKEGRRIREELEQLAKDIMENHLRKTPAEQ